MTPTAYHDDIPLSLARSAHAGTSHAPEQRGDQERDGYAATLAADHEALAQLADTDDKRAQLATEFARYRERYRQLTIAHLAARSRCVSTMIAGPSNFPVRRAQKASDAADRKTQELLEFRARALRAIHRLLRPEDGPILTGAPDAVARLQAEIATLEAKLARMKAANAAIRKHAKAGAEAQVAALVALGVAAGVARELLKPDFAGRVGFADYEIRNTGADLRRLRARLEVVAAAKAAPAVEAEGEGGIRIEDAPAENRVRIYFPDKPDAATRERLKARGYQWAPTSGAWSAFRNAGSIELAREVAGVERLTDGASA